VRLRWLLNALDDQTFPAPRYEVLVAYDSSAADTERLLRTHPLGLTGRLREVRSERGSPSVMRNAAWQAARAPLILFTEDDCRPAADWIEHAVTTARARPGAIVQGRTRPDPDEGTLLRAAPWVETMVIDPPTVWAQTCNIAYPRELLERVGGFDVGFGDRVGGVGEDTDLAMRAQAAGASVVAAPEMLVYHGVEVLWLLEKLRSLSRWQQMAWLVKRHPELRRHVFGRVWLKREHAALVAAAAAPALARRHPVALVIALPWLRLSLGHRGYGARGILRSVSELPGRAAIDATEIAVLARASLRYRTVLL
jgi:hypothetical protein